MQNLYFTGNTEKFALHNPIQDNALRKSHTVHAQRGHSVPYVCRVHYLGAITEDAMIIRVDVMLDDSIPEQAEVLHRLLGWAETTAPAVPREFVNAVKQTKVGREVVIPLIEFKQVGQRYTPQQLGDAVAMKPVVLGKRFTVLGRTEKRFGGIRIFTRHGVGRDRQYSITTEIKSTFLELNE
ncbi:MAG: hypothetical protein ACR2OA_01265 [Rubripirellula sp.]